MPARPCCRNRASTCPISAGRPARASCAAGSRPYDGQAALQATSAVGPLGEWHTVSLRPGTRLRLPAGARDLFVYLSPDLAAGAPYDEQPAERQRAGDRPEPAGLAP